MKQDVLWIPAAVAVLLAILALVSLPGDTIPRPPGAATPTPSGAGGYVTRTVAHAPHPYAFDHPPGWWNPFVDPSRLPGDYGVILQGPVMASGKFNTMAFIEVSPTAATHAERPVPGVVRPYESLDDLERRHWLYNYKREVTHATSAIVDSRTARDVTCDYVRVARSAPHETEQNSVECRGRSVYFEDRGYYYIFVFLAQRTEYSRYLPVFERLLSSFRFLD